MHANDLFKAVMELDLNPIKMKLMHVESGEGWSLEKATAVEKEYRRFLCLMKLYPEEDTAPLVDVDTFWHYHILDTMKYAKDCEQVFGYFLHHYPYVGMRGEDDEQFRLDSGNRMQELYEATFGESYPGAVSEDLQAAAYCASPHVGKDAAYCASPHVSKNAAYCASPHVSKASAYCASPHVGKASAYCASPHVSKDAAYCASPHVSKASAYCASPHVGKASAYCASPHVSKNAAYCASPHVSKNAAYCASPHVSKSAAYCASPHVSKNAAYCASPHVSKTAAALQA